MPIVGSLSEFPLPEVLLLIGKRTGRLRLLDVPECGVLDIDISDGEVQGMHFGSEKFSETEKMLDKLSPIVQLNAGMFEFRFAPIPLVVRSHTLSVHDLALKLVCHVDEQAASQVANQRPGQWHRLVIPQPEIWVEPELNQFFHNARSPLTVGVTQDELAAYLQMDPGLVFEHLSHLRSLGLTELLDGEPTNTPNEESKQRVDLMRKTSSFLHKVHVTEQVRKISGGQ